MFSSSGFEQESCPCAPSAYASTFCQHETTKQYPRAYQSRDKSTHNKSISYFQENRSKTRHCPSGFLHQNHGGCRKGVFLRMMFLETGRSPTICICDSAFTDFGNIHRWHGMSKKSIPPRNTTVSGGMTVPTTLFKFNKSQNNFLF